MNWTLHVHELTNIYAPRYRILNNKKHIEKSTQKYTNFAIKTRQRHPERKERESVFPIRRTTSTNNTLSKRGDATQHKGTLTRAQRHGLKIE